MQATVEMNFLFFCRFGIAPTVLVGAATGRSLTLLFIAIYNVISWVDD